MELLSCLQNTHPRQEVLEQLLKDKIEDDARKMLQLSEFAPVLREIAPGPLTSPSASGIIGLTLEGGGVNRPYDGNLGPSSVCFLGFLLFFF